MRLGSSCDRQGSAGVRRWIALSERRPDQHRLVLQIRAGPESAAPGWIAGILPTSRSHAFQRQGAVSPLWGGVVRSRQRRRRQTGGPGLQRVRCASVSTSPRARARTASHRAEGHEGHEGHPELAAGLEHGDLGVACPGAATGLEWRDRVLAVGAMQRGRPRSPGRAGRAWEGSIGRGAWAGPSSACGGWFKRRTLASFGPDTAHRRMPEPVELGWCHGFGKAQDRLNLVPRTMPAWNCAHSPLSCR
jgi:hypothetical protein